MKKIVRLFPYEPKAKEWEKEILEGIAEVIEVDARDEEGVIAHAKDADGIIAVYEPLTKRVLDEVGHLDFIAYKSIGFNSVDLEEATKKNIPVFHITKYCIKEVADYVMSAILAENRRLFLFDRAVRGGEWNFAMCPDMRRLEEQTVGFVGFGNIPRLVAKRLQGFGCNLIAFDPFVDEETMKEYGVKKVEKETVFEEADFISVHLPLSPKTERSIGRDEFSKVKPGAVLINSARGGVLDEEALVEALEKGNLARAYLDVLTDEYPDLTKNPLANREDVVLTPHIAFYSQESVRDGFYDVARSIKNFYEKNYEAIEFVNRVELP